MTKTRSRRIIYFLLWISSYFIQFSKINAACSGNGFKSCACNFINACVWDAKKKEFGDFTGSTADLNKFLPSNLKVLAKDQTKVAEICEPGLIGILYDCENRIPIATTVVVTADQYWSGYVRRGKFRPSVQIAEDLQQNDDDYDKVSQRIPCYTTKGTTTSFIEQNWYFALTLQTTLPKSPCPSTIRKSPIDRGHLIAAHYGLGDSSNERIKETFVFTNAVPQFAKVNRGAWNQFEGTVIQWARNNCGGAPLHIIVGSIPSTFGVNEERFFGQPGFSDYFSDLDGYRVNVPAYMWTAACCYSTSFTKSTFYLARNQPGNKLGQPQLFSRLFLSIGDNLNGPAENIMLFPQWPSCHDDKNFVGT